MAYVNLTQNSIRFNGTNAGGYNIGEQAPRSPDAHRYGVDPYSDLVEQGIGNLVIASSGAVEQGTVQAEDTQTRSNGEIPARSL